MNGPRATRWNRSQIAQKSGFFNGVVMHLHEFGDVVLLLLDGAAKFTDEGQVFLNLGVEVRVIREKVAHLLAEREYFKFG